MGFGEVGVYVAANLRKVSKRCSLSSASDTFLARKYLQELLIEWRVWSGDLSAQADGEKKEDYRFESPSRAWQNEDRRGRRKG